jgi:hypothetical protein
MLCLDVESVLIPFVILIARIGIPILIILAAVYAFRRTWRQLDKIQRELQAIKMVIAEKD